MIKLRCECGATFTAETATEAVDRGWTRLLGTNDGRHVTVWFCPNEAPTAIAAVQESMNENGRYVRRLGPIRES